VEDVTSMPRSHYSHAGQKLSFSFPAFSRLFLQCVDSSRQSIPPIHLANPCRHAASSQATYISLNPGHQNFKEQLTATLYRFSQSSQGHLTTPDNIGRLPGRVFLHSFDSDHERQGYGRTRLLSRPSRDFGVCPLLPPSDKGDGRPSVQPLSRPSLDIDVCPLLPSDNGFGTVAAHSIPSKLPSSPQKHLSNPSAKDRDSSKTPIRAVEEPISTAFLESFPSSPALCLA
jgi:hypothetical protein